MSGAYYNENDEYAAEWLRNLITFGLIAPGEVDGRSIVDVAADDLRGFTQCHFFAGIGGWSLAARLAGWPDDRPLWTGSCPCQPFSVAGKGQAQADARHLWPEMFRLASAHRPPVIMGEQVAAAAGKGWLDGVFADLEGIGYACGATVVPACAVDAPHRRDRLWFVAEHTHTHTHTLHHALDHAERPRLEGHSGHEDGAHGRQIEDRPVAETGGRVCDVADSSRRGVRVSRRASPENTSGEVSTDSQQRERLWPDVGADGVHRSGFWSDHSWIIGHDGKARRVKPGLPLLAYGIPARVGKLRAAGNAIVPQVAAQVIGAFMDCRP